MSTPIDKYPEAFLKESASILAGELPCFLEALAQEPPVSIHLNNKLPLQQSTFHSVPWYEEGCYIPERIQFTLDPLWHAGAYYVQEASSMFLYQFLRQYVPSDAVMLDMCAAPGGKSIVASSYLTDGLLVSNEFIRTRSRILAENVIKWGNDNVIVTSNASERFELLSGYFDAIIVDAPCSGEGMFRKDEQAISEWSEDNVQNCVNRQKVILRSSWEALASNGVLIYSTCTYNRKENEQMIEWLLSEYDAQYLPLDVDAQWQVTESEYGYRFFPHKTNGEGLFMAAIRKTDTSSRRGRIKEAKLQVDKTVQLKEQLLHPSNYTFITVADDVLALPTCFVKHYMQLSELFYILSAGIKMGTRKGKDLIPDVSLALSKQLNHSGLWGVVDLDRSSALHYLQREAMMVDSESRGYMLLTYKGVALGFVKHLGNRSNNLYPDAWRIRMPIPLTLPKDLFDNK